MNLIRPRWRFKIRTSCFRSEKFWDSLDDIQVFHDLAVLDSEDIDDGAMGRSVLGAVAKLQSRAEFREAYDPEAIADRLDTICERDWIGGR